MNNLRDPSAPAAIMATFSDWRTVKSRKALQLVFEVSLEQQAEVLTMLGAPLPDQPQWCAIALLNTEQASRRDDGERPMPSPILADRSEGGASLAERSERAKAAYRDMTPAEQAVQRAGMLAGHPLFQAWCAKKIFGDNGPVSVVCLDEAEVFIRETCCDGNSRSLIAVTPEYMDRFQAMETEYLIASGGIAEPR